MTKITSILLSLALATESLAYSTFPSTTSTLRPTSTSTSTSTASDPLHTAGKVPKQLNAIRRRPGLTHKEYLKYHVLKHGALAWAAPPDTQPQVYVQDHVFDSVFGTNSTPYEPAFFGRDDLTELYCNNISQFVASAQAPYVQQVIAPDGASFNDYPFAVSMFAYETFVSSPATTPNADCAPNRNVASYYNSPGTVTAFYWLSAQQASQSFDNTTFAINVNNALQRQLAAYAPSSVYNASIHIPITGTDSTQFYGGFLSPPMSAVIKLFLCDADAAVDGVRAAQKAIQSMTALGVNFNSSFMVFAREVTLWDLNHGIQYNTTRLAPIIKAETIY